MQGIHAVFADLQPIARPMELVRRVRHARLLIDIEDRKIRFGLRWTHIGPDHSGIFMDMVGAMEHSLGERIVIAVGRRLEDGAVDIEVPAVVAAANTGLVELAVFERGAAVRAMQLQEPEPAAEVAKTEPDLRPGYAIAAGTFFRFSTSAIGCQKQRKILSARCIGADASQLLIGELGRFCRGGRRRRRRARFAHCDPSMASPRASGEQDSQGLARNPNTVSLQILKCRSEAVGMRRLRSFAGATAPGLP